MMGPNEEGRCFIFGKELTAAGIWFHGLWYGFDGYNVALDINLGINIIICKLLTYALFHTNKAIYPFAKRDEEVFFLF